MSTASTNPLPFRALSVAVGPTGAIAVAWLQGGTFVDSSDTQYVAGDVYAALARPGEPFRVQRLATGVSVDRKPALAFSRSGSAVVAWADYRPQLAKAGDSPRFNAISAAYSSTAETFGTPTTLQTFSPGSNPDRLQGGNVVSAAFDDRGAALVAWTRLTDREVIPTASVRPRGGAFSPAQPLAGPRTGLDSIYAAGGGRGTSAVVWQANTSEGPVVETSIHLPG